MERDALLFSREKVRELDRLAIQERGVSSLLLMENAGAACAREALAMLGETGGEVLILAGPGNNGGDGFVIARHLLLAGRAVRTMFFGSREKLEAASEDVRVNLQRLRALGHEVLVRGGGIDSSDLRGKNGPPELIVDALFGTGLTRPLRAPWIEAVEALASVRELGCSVLAVDLPSGLDANTGEVLGAALRADVTVTFVAAKPGFYRGAGPGCVGRVVVAEIGIPEDLIEAAREG